MLLDDLTKLKYDQLIPEQWEITNVTKELRTAAENGNVFQIILCTKKMKAWLRTQGLLVTKIISNDGCPENMRYYQVSGW